MTKTWHKALFVVGVVFVTFIAINSDPTGILKKIASINLLGSFGAGKKAA